MTVNDDPEARARSAAEALSAEGLPVTARAVRRRSGVAMKLAADIARDWNQTQTDARHVPTPPETVTARFEALWREAYAAATAEFNEARAGWQTRLATAEAERDDIAHDLETVETERDAARADLRNALEHAAADEQAATAALELQRTVADRAEARADALHAERDQLREDLTAARDHTAQLQSVADKATARADTIQTERDRLLAEIAELRVRA